ncbi:MAG: hypothetical protein IPG77_04940 [Betaproteobacteria bacterium]|nr:hypothetical protein [Betaproteobacteria bacterium]
MSAELKQATQAPRVLTGLGATRSFGTEKASYWRDGVSAKEDYRYWAMFEYLKLSPSFLAVSAHLRGTRCKYPLPTDFEVVSAVAKDFSLVSTEVEPWEWWKQEGKHLFGIRTPDVKVRVFPEVLTEKKNAISVSWDRSDAIVLRVSLNQTKREAMALISRELEKQEFSKGPPEQYLPKYSFMTSKIRHSSLALGAQVLSYYTISERELPLWWIGNAFGLIPGQCFTEEQMERSDHQELAAKRNVLTIAASRLIRTSILIAENAARGRFPSAEPFPEAQRDAYKRTPGRRKSS